LEVNGMVTRLIISLDGEERNALNELSQKELRDPRDQIRILLRLELERIGLLKSTTKMKITKINDHLLEENNDGK
jgi:hypothetical protein